MTTTLHLATALADAADIRLLHEICFRPNDRASPSTRRPETPEITQSPPNAKWLRVLRQLYATIRNGGASSLGNFFQLLQERRCTEKNTNAVLRAIAAILYDQECSGNPSLIGEATETELGNAVPNDDIFELAWVTKGILANMLLVDYGVGVYPLYVSVNLQKGGFQRYHQPVLERFCKYMTEFAGRCKQGQLSGWEGWLYLGRCLAYFRKYDSADVAVMLYYYHTRRRKLDRAEYEKGMTGYRGVLHELVAEVSTVGTERLLRKLSVDVNELIPRVISWGSQRRRMILAAENIAALYGISLYGPDVKGTATPPPETMDQGELPKQKDKSWDTQTDKSWDTQKESRNEQKEKSWLGFFRAFLPRSAIMLGKEKLKVD